MSGKRIGCSGMTLIEVLVSASIIAILVALFLPSLEVVRGHMERVVCMNHLQMLRSAFSTHLEEGHGWPQVPKGMTLGSREEHQWWLDMSKKTMNLDESLWKCPTLRRSSQGSDEDAPLISYLPTIFDAKPDTPNMWPNMPWFTEIANIHGGGHLSVKSDGSISAEGGVIPGLVK